MLNDTLLPVIGCSGLGIDPGEQEDFSRKVSRLSMAARVHLAWLLLGGSDLDNEFTCDALANYSAHIAGPSNVQPGILAMKDGSVVDCRDELDPVAHPSQAFINLQPLHAS